MHSRSLRIMLLLIFLICLVTFWSGSVAARAAPRAAPTERSFQPSGLGIALPTVVNTAALPLVHVSGSTAISAPASAPGNPRPVLASHAIRTSQNVVSVAPPGSTDPSAKQGLFQQGGKPDANGAGGIDNYLETVNSAVGIYSRSGTLQMAVTFQNWFGIKSNFYDPVTMWDGNDNRFLFSALQTGVNTIWLAVAQQTNATGRFCNYSFPTLANHDFDKLGGDRNGIYFGFNVLDPHTNKVVNNELFYAGRVALESCQQTRYTTWSKLTNPNGSIAQAITPARNDSSTASVEYLVNSFPLGACQLTLWTLTSRGTLTNTIVPTQCYSPPPNARQKGSSALISTGDCSITQASLVNGLLTVDMPDAYDWGDGNGPVSIVAWYVINPSSASVASQGAFGTPGYWLFYPSTITTANGHMLFVYNASGPSIYPSVWYVNQTLTGATALANGTSYYGTRGVSAWGDYQSAWSDAGSGAATSVWITGEFAKAPGTWGTAFDLVTP